MEYTVVLETTEETHAGSTPVSPTKAEGGNYV